MPISIFDNSVSCEMANSRDNFSAAIKSALGRRVAFRCCFPGCGVLTIGPKSMDSQGHVNLGEAAHIHAASPGGPRYAPEMSIDDRKSFQNGIWMCRHHARLIDADEGQYSAETIQQWKRIAEAETYRQLKELTKSTIPDPTTIVCLNQQLIFEGIWIGAVNNTWRFEVKKFIYGDFETLRKFQIGAKPTNNYIIIESQGDGRMINHFEWEQNENHFEIKVNVFPSTVRRNPNHIGTGPAIGENMLENGRWRLISGKELAIQKIEFLLNTSVGTRFMNPSYGTLFSLFYRNHKNDQTLLKRLIKVELTRLITIPTDEEHPERTPELSFISRINEVEILDEENSRISLRLVLEWGDGSSWIGVVKVFIDDRKH